MGVCVNADVFHLLHISLFAVFVGQSIPTNTHIPIDVFLVVVVRLHVVRQSIRCGLLLPMFRGLWICWLQL